MLLIPHIDIKTGQVLTETTAEGMTQPQQKEIAHVGVFSFSPWLSGHVWHDHVERQGKK